VKFSVNHQDLKFSLLVSLAVSIAMGVVCVFIKGAKINAAYGVTLDTLSTFSLTFLGFIITSFTVLQMIHSKDYFEKIKTTRAFSDLLNEFKLLIIISICGILVSLFFRVGVSLLIKKYFLVAGICLASSIIAFLCSLAWKTISAIVALFKV
jgi:hypothetical protein